MKYYQALNYARQMRKNPTEAEGFMWQKVKNRQLGGNKFYRQYLLKHSVVLKNPLFYIVDFCCFKGRLIIEIDGAYHDNISQMKYDQERQLDLESMGYRVVRFTNEQVLNDWFKVEEKIMNLLLK